MIIYSELLNLLFIIHKYYITFYCNYSEYYIIIIIFDEYYNNTSLVFSQKAIIIV